MYLLQSSAFLWFTWRNQEPKEKIIFGPISGFQVCWFGIRFEVIPSLVQFAVPISIVAVLLFFIAHSNFVAGSSTQSVWAYLSNFLFYSFKRSNPRFNSYHSYFYFCVSFQCDMNNMILIYCFSILLGLNSVGIIIR